jgi:hypothetical protein
MSSRQAVADAYLGASPGGHFRCNPARPLRWCAGRHPVEFAGLAGAEAEGDELMPRTSGDMAAGHGLPCPFRRTPLVPMSPARQMLD